MSALDELITNRTALDAAAIREVEAIKYTQQTQAQRQIYNYGIGAYRHTDFNRVGAACAELYDLITANGETVPDYVPLRTDYIRDEDISFAEMTQYLATVAALKAAYSASTPIPANMRFITYEDANNIERLLLEVEDILIRRAKIYPRSGVYVSGAVWYIPEDTYEDTSFNFASLNFANINFGG